MEVAAWWQELNRVDAWMDLTTRVLKKLEYPLLVMTLSYEEYRSILRHLLEVGLLAVGICRFMHQAIVHGLIKYQGHGIPSLYITQGIMHLEALLDAIPT